MRVFTAAIARTTMVTAVLGENRRVAASAHDTGTRPDATGRPRFFGLSRSSARSQTSLSR